MATLYDPKLIRDGYERVKAGDLIASRAWFGYSSPHGCTSERAIIPAAEKAARTSQPPWKAPQTPRDWYTQMLPLSRDLRDLTLAHMAGPYSFALSIQARLNYLEENLCFAVPQGTDWWDAIQYALPTLSLSLTFGSLQAIGWTSTSHGMAPVVAELKRLQMMATNAKLLESIEELGWTPSNEKMYGNIQSWVNAALLAWAFLSGDGSELFVYGLDHQNSAPLPSQLEHAIGAFVVGTGPYHGPYDSPADAFLMPDEQRLADSGGDASTGYCCFHLQALCLSLDILGARYGFGKMRTLYDRIARSWERYIDRIANRKYPPPANGHAYVPVDDESASSIWGKIGFARPFIGKEWLVLADRPLANSGYWPSERPHYDEYVTGFVLDAIMPEVQP